MVLLYTVLHYNVKNLRTIEAESEYKQKRFDYFHFTENVLSQLNEQTHWTALNHSYYTMFFRIVCSYCRESRWLGLFHTSLSQA